MGYTEARLAVTTEELGLQLQWLGGPTTKSHFRLAKASDPSLPSSHPSTKSPCRANDRQQ
ncbi:putative macrophage mannose receptor 1-like [Sesbania bispinosa]|nr:putative macrophage mannose receptor 1-like [Sesbania bispinosa]